jgi:hypothetical protein
MGEMEREIWRVTDKDVRDILAGGGLDLPEEGVQALLARLAVYLDVARRLCVVELARDRNGPDGQRRWQAS